MQAVDFSKLLDLQSVGTVLPGTAVRAENVYQGFDGLQFRYGTNDGELLQDLVRLGNGAFLFASDFSPRGERDHWQIVQDTDWVHLQFRVKGGGRERVSHGTTIETPEGCCIVARYPKDCIIERQNDPTAHWKVACLLLSPRGLTDFLDVSAASLPERAQWMAVESALELRAEVLPLQSTTRAAVNDILSCQMRGGNRRAYMRSKSLELLTTVIHLLDSLPPGAARPAVRLSAADLQKLALSRLLMTQELDSGSTLAQLSRRVGLNRTKLALGFKEVYGSSVQAYWRDARLNRARELLAQGNASVTEVALKVGYAEISSFSRAFSRKFGFLPRDCRS